MPILSRRSFLKASGGAALAGGAVSVTAAAVPDVLTHRIESYNLKHLGFPYGTEVQYLSSTEPMRDHGPWIITSAGVTALAYVTESVDFVSRMVGPQRRLSIHNETVRQYLVTDDDLPIGHRIVWPEISYDRWDRGMIDPSERPQ